MRTLAITAALILAGCSSAPTDSKPDQIPKLIAARYSDCVPGLKAADVWRVTDKRYVWSSDKWSLAWKIGVPNAKTGEPFTTPAPDAMSQFEKLGCV